MKKVFIIATFLLSSTFMFAQDKGSLTVTFDDFKDPEGKIYVAVYEKDNFLRQPSQTTTLEVKAENNQVTLEDIAFGEYAISVFHDLNSNGRFDMNENQMPAEPWGMSGTVNPMQRPTWESAKIKFDSSGQVLNLSLFK